MKPMLIKFQDEILPEHKHCDPTEEIDHNDDPHQHQGCDVLRVLESKLRGPKEHGGYQQDGDKDDAGCGDAQPGEQVRGDLPESSNYQQSIYQDLSRDRWVLIMHNIYESYPPTCIQNDEKTKISRHVTNQSSLWTTSVVGA